MMTPHPTCRIRQPGQVRAATPGFWSGDPDAPSIPEDRAGARTCGAARVIDCSAGAGASGSAMMLPGSFCAMVGILVGWTSTHPDSPGPFAPTNMNFAVAVEGPFRAAILAMTGGPEPTPIDTSPTETAQAQVSAPGRAQ